jgi:hypothetical protein
VGDKTRLRRPALERTTPHRSWAASVSAGPSAEGVIETGVRDANRVIDDYLTTGQASARALRNAIGIGAANGNVQDVATRMMRAASDLMSFWFDFMAQSAPAAGPAAGMPQGSAPQSIPATVSERRAPVVVQVDALRPVAVTVDLRSGTKTSRFSLDRLHPVRKGAPPLTGVHIEAPEGDGPIVVSVSVAAEQPAGVYNGVVLDEATSRPLGTISVDIRPARRATRASRFSGR